MSTNNEKFTELCTGYVVGALNKGEEREFLAMLAKADEDQLRLYDDMKAIASELAVLTKAEEPSASVKQSILSIIEEKSDSGNSAEKASIYSFTQFKR